MLLNVDSNFDNAAIPTEAEVNLGVERVRYLMIAMI